MLPTRSCRGPLASDAALSVLAFSLNSLSLCSKHAHLQPRATTFFVRHASHAQQGRANGPTDSAGRRLGAKKGSSEWVVPGNIIFKQRGTLWFPGENVGIGKDHTLYALESGYVRYYRDPQRHPKRRYIGVALEREGPQSELPTPRNAPSRRRLGMYASPIKVPESQASAGAFLEAHLSANSRGDSPVKSSRKTPSAPSPPVIIRSGTTREANVSVGRAAERKGVQVRKFDRSDRWLAWRKRGQRVEKSVAAKAAKGSKKTKGKKSAKGTQLGAKRK